MASRQSYRPGGGTEARGKGCEGPRVKGGIPIFAWQAASPLVSARPVRFASFHDTRTKYRRPFREDKKKWGKGIPLPKRKCSRRSSVRLLPCASGFAGTFIPSTIPGRFQYTALSFTLRPARVILASFESLSFLCKSATEAQPDFPWFAARVSLAYGPCVPKLKF